MHKDHNAIQYVSGQMRFQKNKRNYTVWQFSSDLEKIQSCNFDEQKLEVSDFCWYFFRQPKEIATEISKGCCIKSKLPCDTGALHASQNFNWDNCSNIRYCRTSSTSSVAQKLQIALSSNAGDHIRK